MGISFKHQAAGVALSGSGGGKSGSDKYAFPLAQIAQKQRYQFESSERAKDRWNIANNRAQELNFRGQQAEIDRVAQFNRDNRLTARQDQMRKEGLEQQQAELARLQQQEARSQEVDFIEKGIQSGAYDDATSKALRQGIMQESRIMQSTEIDPIQKEDALRKIREKRAIDAANYRQQPTQDEVNRQHFWKDDQGREWLMDPKGGKPERIMPDEQEQAPQSSVVPFEKQYEGEGGRERFDKEFDKIKNALEQKALMDEDGKKTDTSDKAVEDEMRRRHDRYNRLHATGPQTSGWSNTATNLAGAVGAGVGASLGVPTNVWEEAATAGPSNDPFAESAPTTGGQQAPPAGQQQLPSYPPVVSGDQARQAGGGIAQGMSGMIPSQGGQPQAQPSAPTMPQSPMAGDGQPYSPRWLNPRPPELSNLSAGASVAQGLVDIVPTGGQQRQVAGVPVGPDPAAVEADAMSQNPMTGGPGVSAQAPAKPMNFADIKTVDIDGMIKKAKPADKADLMSVKAFLLKGHPPEVANAIGVMLSPDSDEAQLKQAAEYLLSQEIDLAEVMEQGEAASKPLSKPSRKPAKSATKKHWTQSGSRGGY